MAQVVGGKIKLGSGALVTPQQGGWYDGQQYWGGSLSNPGQINAQSNQQGAGQQVSAEVNKQTSIAAGKAPDANQNFINAQTAAGVQGTPAGTGGAGGGGGYGGGVPGGGAGIDGGLGAPNGGVPDLLGMYSTLQSSSGINDLHDQLNKATQGYDKAQSQINDNPFLSEANRVGRIQKLSNDYQNSTKAITDQISQKQADNDMQIQLAQKQYDINSTAAKAAMDQFNTLLSSGALDNASGDDIANLTRATGMSSNMIQGAINASKAKNVPTATISFDDGQNQGFAVINTKTGEIINKQVVAQSKILGTAEDKAAYKTTGGGSSGGKMTQADINAQNLTNLKASIKSGTTLKSLVDHFGGALKVNDIYNLYNAGSPNGRAKESIKQVQSGKYADL